MDRFGLWKSVPILKGPKNGSEIRSRFWPRFHTSWPSPVNCSLLKFETKRREQKPRESYDFLCRICSKQQFADEQVATTTGNKNCVAVHLLHQRLKRVLRHCGSPCPWQCFRAVFNPQNRPLIWLGCCHLRPIHISELLQLASRS